MKAPICPNCGTKMRCMKDVEIYYCPKMPEQERVAKVVAMFDYPAALKSKKNRRGTA